MASATKPHKSRFWKKPKPFFGVNWAWRSSGSEDQRSSSNHDRSRQISNKYKLPIGSKDINVQIMLQRWRREFIEFFFTKGSALTVAIAFIVGQQFTRIVDSVTKDLLMPLLNPFVPKGSFEDLKINYFGGAIEIGKLVDTIVEALLVAWMLFLILKAIKRIERQTSASTEESGLS
ncbi:MULTISPECIES: MscL family protein [unclassified Synechococcus]|uniref:large conductance mechanosensitive channel protein MscL n=2 Tax=unclassified Synechococcus TaxID=2626047 RepID=UPI001CF8CB81|nr:MULTISPECIES: MscL family protein [unclassified Synechococcus]